MKKILLAIVVLSALIFSGAYLYNYKPTQILGNYYPTGGGTYRLQSSIGGSDSSLTLTSFKEPISNIKYTMSYLNSSIEYATIEPQSSNKEFVSFTGITQNSDGTATLTGLTRGLSFSYPYTASSTLQQAHSGQSILILSNPPQLYNNFYNLNNVATSSNTLIFSSTTPPHYDFVAAQGTGTFISSTSEFASVAYVNAVTLTSAPNGTTGIKGVYQSATGLQAASTTALGSTGASLALTSAIATDTPSIPQSVSGSKVVMSLITGYLSQTWLDLTAAFTTTGTWVFQGAVTIAASASKNLTLNGVPYTFPATQGGVGTVFVNDGSGNLSSTVIWTNLVSTTTSVAMQYATTTWSGNYQNLQFVFNQPSTASQAGSELMYFNSDRAANYAYQGFGSLAAGVGYNANGQSRIDLNNLGTTSPEYTTGSIINIAANRKIVQWKDSLSATGATMGTTTEASGVWNNTSSAITSIVFFHDTGTIPSGTTIEVFGSN